MIPEKSTYFKAFPPELSHISPPTKFTFPFYYEPHPLALKAAEILQKHLLTQKDWQHDFGLNDSQDESALGKMFGVLVVENPGGELGFLSAFSGKLAGVNHLPGFVPPVFDMLREGDFYREGEEELNTYNRKIEKAEKEPAYLKAKKDLAKTHEKAAREIETLKIANQLAKKERKEKRAEAKESLSKEQFAFLEKALAKESMDLKYKLKRLRAEWAEKLQVLESELGVLQEHIRALKKERKDKSNALQERLFHNYSFLNFKEETKNLRDIFGEEVPPSGAGECAAPKLLHYAYREGYKPIALAEFWWGVSPKSAVRLHRQFYPACTGKCKPILGHMLQGLEVDENPLLTNPALGKELPIVYEDEHILVVNKPAEFLSAPGIHIQDSVQFRMQVKYPKATGPMVVHRLDMSTSGLLLVAKSKEHYTFLQKQFLKRKVKKRYVAWLDGIVKEDSGTIDLPLRVDLDNRPQQLICYDYGKRALTEWKVVERTSGRTKVHFFPLTGRTHQLRVHAAHPLGLGMPIVGDDIYGKREKRLYLHAESLEFIHPETLDQIHIEAMADFDL